MLEELAEALWETRDRAEPERRSAQAQMWPKVESPQGRTLAPVKRKKAAKA